MRFVLLVFVWLAGCDLANRGFSEIEYLQSINRLLQADDRCGVQRYVLLRPRALSRDDELSSELRDFVRESREECSPKDRSGADASISDQSERIERSGDTGRDQGNRNSSQEATARGDHRSGASDREADRREDAADREADRREEAADREADRRERDDDDRDDDDQDDDDQDDDDRDDDD